MRNRFAVLTMIALLAIFNVACETEPETDVVDADTGEEMEVVDEELDPAHALGAVPVQVIITDTGIQIPSSIGADTAALTVENQGEQEHHFSIEGENFSESLEEPLQPGEVMTMDVSLQPGEYRAVCEAAGLEQSFTVTPIPADETTSDDDAV